MRSRKLLVVALLVLIVASVCWGQSVRKAYVLNYKRLSTEAIGVTCANGGDPTGQKVGDLLIISCGK